MKYIRIISWLLVPLSLGPSAAGAVDATTRVSAAEDSVDASTTDSVLAAIQNDDILRYYAADVRVSTHAGVVTLDGVVPRSAIRQRMAQVARAVAGVSRVVNLITLESKG